MSETAFDAAQADADIAAGFDDFRRGTGILIRQRIHDHMREFFFNPCRNGIDEMEQRAGVTAVFRIDLCAVRAFAGIIAVVLRHGNDPCSGMIAQALFCIFRGDGNDLRIGQTELRAVLEAFAVYHGKILGMGIEIPVWIYQLVE